MTEDRPKKSLTGHGPITTELWEALEVPSSSSPLCCAARDVGTPPHHQEGEEGWINLKRDDG